MNCAMALELLLDAEPAELALAAASPLVAHLRSCDRCRAVAGRLHADTMRLAERVVGRQSVFMSRAANRTRWKRVGALAAAAVIVATLTLRTAQQGVDPTGAGNPEAATLTPAPAVPAGADVTRPGSRAAGRTRRVGSAIASGRAERAPSVVGHAGQPPSVAGLVQVVAEPQRSVAVSGEVAGAAAGSPSQNVADIGGISVVSPPGTRVMVFATRDPGITIVWLQADDSLRIPR